MAVSVSPSFVVDTTHYHDQEDSLATALPDGRFFVAWTTFEIPATGSGSFETRARFMNADGSGVADDVLVSPAGGNHNRVSGVLALPDGRVLVNNSTILNQDGTKTDISFSSGIESFPNGSMSMTADGRLLGTFLRQSFASNSTGGGTYNYEFLARYFTTGGTPIGDSFKIGPEVNGYTVGAEKNKYSLYTKPLSDGRFVFAFTEIVGSKVQTALQIAGADGRLIGNEAVIPSAYGFDIIELSNGRIAVTCNSAGTLTTRILNADGSAVPGDYLYSTGSTDHRLVDWETVRLSGDRIAVFWCNDINGQVRYMSGQVLNSDLSAATPVFEVTPRDKEDERVDDAVVLKDGRIALTWTARETNSVRFEVRAALIEVDGAPNPTPNPLPTPNPNPTPTPTPNPQPIPNPDPIPIPTPEPDEDRVLNGSGETDDLSGQGGDDQLFGFDGNDRLAGGDGDDLLSGGRGSDDLIGGLGADTLSGGKGADRYIYTSVLDGADTIQNFRSGDKFAFVGEAFGITRIGTLKDGRLVSSAKNKALDSNDRFIFRTGDDTLWYDADGKGGAAPIKIADLINDFDLRASDILII
jgi:hypothetical protein